MKRCSSPDHPHCTVWVAPGEAQCAHGHRQPSGAVDVLGSSFEMLKRVRAEGPARIPATIHAPPPRPHLHVSGFDPRAAGGRQAIKLELRGMPDDAPAQLTLLLESKLLPMGAGRLWLRPGEVDPEHEGVKALEAAVQEVTGEPAVVREFNGGWVDAAELMRPNARGFGEPAAITFGPGDFEQAHAVDEHIEISEVAKAAEIYARAARALLV